MKLNFFLFWRPRMYLQHFYRIYVEHSLLHFCIFEVYIEYPKTCFAPMKYLFAKAYSVVKKWGYCQPPSRTSHKSLPFQCQLLQIRKSKKLRKNLEKKRYWQFTTTGTGPYKSIVFQRLLRAMWLFKLRTHQFWYENSYLLDGRWRSEWNNYTIKLFCSTIGNYNLQQLTSDVEIY